MFFSPAYLIFMAPAFLLMMLAYVFAFDVDKFTLDGRPQQVPARQGWRVLQLAETVRQKCQEQFLTLGAARARLS